MMVEVAVIVEVEKNSEVVLILRDGKGEVSSSGGDESGGDWRRW